MKLVLGVVLAFLVGVVTIGGIRRIAVVAERIVPVMCVAYALAALVVLAMKLPSDPGSVRADLPLRVHTHRSRWRLHGCGRGPNDRERRRPWHLQQ